MFGLDCLSIYPARVERQLLNQLPGIYEFHRDKHHDMLISNWLVSDQHQTHADIDGPARGMTKIVSRPPTHPEYDFELLEVSIFSMVTTTGAKAGGTEARVFRLKGGQWSLWNTGNGRSVTEKITDLTMEDELTPGYAKLRTVRPQWVDGRGITKYLGFDFFEYGQLWWTMHHRIEKKDGQTTLQKTTYKKLPTEKTEAWPEWLNQMWTGGLGDMKLYFMT